MWQGVDRRRFPRANYPCKIILARKGQRQKLSTHTENIGLGGVCVIMNQELERFSEVELMLFLKDRQPAVRCDARIVWMVKKLVPSKKNSTAEFDTGLEFVNLEEKEKARVEKVVQECLQKQNLQDIA